MIIDFIVKALLVLFILDEISCEVYVKSCARFINTLYVNFVLFCILIRNVHVLIKDLLN